MANELEVAGTEYAHIGTAGVAWNAAVYYAAPPLGNEPVEMSPEYDELPYAFPGVDGTATKNLGFRGQDIRFELLFVNTSRANCRTAFASIVTTLQADRFTVTVPGGTQRAGCKLKRGGAQELKFIDISGKHVLLARFEVRRMS